jgi:N-hydroxyarylamine O-acetyltransferase
VVALDRYFGRIGWRGDVSPTLATLAGLLRSHTRTIPFENLDVLLQRPVRLDLASLQAKLVGARRGGYCFEHATLFAAVLEALGFAPIRHTARVVLYAPRAEVPRTHMVLTVPVGAQTFVVDPGFGSLAPRVPVPLVDRPDAPSDATHWMTRDDDHWVLRSRTPDAIVNCWATTLERDNLVDFEVGNHYTATHAASPFVNRLMLRAITDDGHVAVMNRDVTRVDARGSHSRRLAGRAELRALLNEDFGFDLPDVESMRVPAIDEWR